MPIRYKKKFEISQMFCTHCGQEGISIPRCVGSYKEPGHLKKIYCPHCHQMFNHVEIKPYCSDYNYEDFTLEMTYHNFDEDGNRIMPYRIFRGHLKQEGII